MAVQALRTPVLDWLLELAPIRPGARLRVLEVGTDPQGGASAADLAVRAGGSVVSLSTATRVTGAARSAHPQYGRLTFRAGPLAAGWPPGGPYDLVLSWEVMDRIPHAWVVQCAPGGRVLSPVWLHKPAGGAAIGVVRLTLDKERLLTWPPQVAMPASGDGRAASPTWLLHAALPSSDQDSYGFSCGCPRCVPAAALKSLDEQVATGDRWIRPIEQGAAAHLAAIEYRTVGRAWLSLCGTAFNPAVAADRRHRRCSACVLLQNRADHTGFTARPGRHPGRWRCGSR